MSRIFFFAALGLSAAAHAGETRFAIDPRVDLAVLAQSGEVDAIVERRNGMYVADASAVLSVDIDRLSAISADYDQYVQIGMPNLRESVVVKAEADRRWIWTRMESFGSNSLHYLEARIRPVLSDSPLFRAVPPVASRGIEWVLYRTGTHSGPEFSRADQPAFQKLDGSWYMRPLSDGRVYVRYFLVADVDAFLPDALMAGMVKKRLRDGVRQVVRVLARSASMRQ